MAFTGTTRGKNVIFRAASLLAEPKPRVLFRDDNEDIISNHLATLKLVLSELDCAGSLFLSLEGYCTP